MGKRQPASAAMTPEPQVLLRAAGLRVTAVRTRVLTVLARAGRPLTHPELAQERDLRGLDRVTLYRTLGALEAAGLAHRVQGTDGAWRTCFHDAGAGGCPGGHPHFLCLRCGAMRCLAQQVLPRVRVPRGATVEGKQLLVYGRCGACAGKPPP